ncbi:pilus assembly protein TadG-related protein [uncultured Jannaschia sp.]|uniref:pilus assembly protein TadG-related protein n=1 Tax=uncultured Jannaschia sp. TaxID=293347 RepID=UPI00261C37EE|nr:pilus assembly protein TadG-related protein [uncultured Jannaschia sp.]
MSISLLHSFLRDEDGAGTIHGLYWLLAMMTIGAVAVDGANSWRVKAQVRNATDAAALAAAQRLDNPAAARAAAVQIAAMNLETRMHGTPVGVEDVSFGHFDSTTGFFSIDEVNPTAVKVDGQRSFERGNPIRTALLGIVAQDSIDLNTFTIAEAIVVAAPPATGTAHPCGNITVLTEARADLVGNAELDGAVCVHGAVGASAENNNLVANGARISSEELDDVQITALRAGSDDIDDIKAEVVMDPVILPTLSDLFVDTWNTLWALPDGHMYQGPLVPRTLTDGPLQIVKVDKGWWQISKKANKRPESDRIYLVNHGMKIQNGATIRDMVFIVRGTAAFGGSGTILERNFFFAQDAIDVRGNSTIGAANYCSTGQFDTYLFSPTSVKYRGGTTVNGLVTAAPVMDTTGALTVTGGLYFEASNDVKIRGANTMTACATPLASDFPMAQPEPVSEDEETAGTSGTTKARLIR